MLQQIRDKAQGWIAWVIVIAIGITFVLFGAGSYFSSNPQDKLAAKVNDEKITVYDLDRAVQQHTLQQAQFNTPQLSRQQVLESLIQQELLDQLTNELGLKISQQRISQIISQSYYRDAPIPNLYNEMQKMQKASQLQHGVVETSFSIANDIDSLIRFKDQTRDLRYTVVPYGSQAGEQISDAQIAEFYNQNIPQFMTPETVAIEYIHLSYDEIVKHYQPTDDELLKFYKENKSLFNDPERVRVSHIFVKLNKKSSAEDKVAAEAKIKEVQQKITAGEDFSALAKQYSEDEGTSEKGGDLNWLVRGEIFPEFEKAAFALQTKGKVSEPVQTDYGWHLIKLTDREEEVIHPFAEVKSQVRQKLISHYGEEKLISDADEVIALAYDHPDSLQPIADKFSLKINKSNHFSKDNPPTTGIISNAEVVEAAFSPVVKEEKYNSDLIKIGNHDMLVIRISEHRLPEQQSLDSVKADIQARLVFANKKQQAQQSAEKILSKLTSAVDEAQQQAILNELQWIEKQKVTKYQTGVLQEILDQAFSLPKFKLQGPAPVAATVELDSGDFAVVWLNAVTDGDPNSMTGSEKERFAELLDAEFGKLEFALLLDQFEQQSEVKNKLQATQ